MPLPAHTHGPLPASRTPRPLPRLSGAGAPQREGRAPPGSATAPGTELPAALTAASQPRAGPAPVPGAPRSPCPGRRRPPCSGEAPRAPPCRPRPTGRSGTARPRDGRGRSGGSTHGGRGAIGWQRPSPRPAANEGGGPGVMGCLSREGFLETLQCGGAPGAAHPPCRLPSRFASPCPARRRPSPKLSVRRARGAERQSRARGRSAAHPAPLRAAASPREGPGQSAEGRAGGARPGCQVRRQRPGATRPPARRRLELGAAARAGRRRRHMLRGRPPGGRSAAGGRGLPAGGGGGSHKGAPTPAPPSSPFILSILSSPRPPPSARCPAARVRLAEPSLRCRCRRRALARGTAPCPVAPGRGPGHGRVYLQRPARRPLRHCSPLAYLFFIYLTPPLLKLSR